jgi:hypothetical protein
MALPRVWATCSATRAELPSPAGQGFRRLVGERSEQADLAVDGLDDSALPNGLLASKSRRSPQPQA